MDVTISCIGLIRSAVILSEILLFMFRQEFKVQGITSIMHSRFYKNVQSNDKCLCGSGLKYKKCCRNEVEKASSQPEIK